MAWNLGGEVAKCDHREYGFAQVQISKLGNTSGVDALFDGLGDEMQVRLLVFILSNAKGLRCTRSGCRTATSFRVSRRNFTSLVKQRVHRMPLSHITRNLSMASNFILRLRIHREERRLLVDSYSTLSAAKLTGPWYVHYTSHYRC
jgi:hypothetical protein